MDAITATPAADRLAKARAHLANATTAAKLATAKRARLAAEVRALEAEAEAEAMRIQARADRERAEAAEARADAADAALAAERAAHLAEEREHAAEVEGLKPRGLVQKRATGRKDTAANGHIAPTAAGDPGACPVSTATPLAVVPPLEPPAHPDAGKPAR